MINKEKLHSSTAIVDKKFIFPFILVTSLFALWGFANAVTDPMVNAFKKVLELSNSEAAWVQMAFYGGYFSMALPAAVFIRKFNYKKGIQLGLFLYALGALMFYPAAITEKFWFFCLGLYVLTFGLAFLETTANPYVLAMGDKSTATRRLNLAQVFNPIGLLIGLLIAQQFVLKNLKSDDISSFENLDIECPICFELFDDSLDIAELECKHKYHFECLTQWYNKPETKYKCPSCYVQRDIIKIHPKKPSIKNAKSKK